MQIIGPSYKKHGTDWLIGTCASRLRQSPISIDRLLKSPPQYFADFDYKVIDDPLILKAQEGMLSVDLSQKLYGGVVYNEEWYPITKIDIHGPAEHLFKGYQNPVELQLVHRKVTDPQQTLILSILVWCENPPPPPNISQIGAFQVPSPNEVDWNENIQKFLTAEVPFGEGTSTTIPPQGLDLNIFVNNPLVPGSGEYMNYRGSLTSPPCLDSTTWFVRRETMIASRSQVAGFMNSLYRLTQGAGSYRSIMPMNRRFLKVYELQQKAGLVVRPYEVMPWSENPRTDGEMQAAKLAKLAAEKAEHAAFYGEGFARRLRNADMAWAKTLQGHLLSEAQRRAEDEARKQAERDTQYAQSVRRVRAAVLGAAHDVQRAVDQGFRLQAQGVYQTANVENSVANTLFNVGQR